MDKKLDPNHLPDRWNKVTLTQLAELMSEAIRTHLVVKTYNPDNPRLKAREELIAVLTDKHTFVPSAVFDWLQLYAEEHNRYFDMRVSEGMVVFRLWEDEPIILPPQKPQSRKEAV